MKPDTGLGEHDPWLVRRDQDFKVFWLSSAGADARGALERTASAGMCAGRGQHLDSECATVRAAGKLRFRHLYDPS